MSLLRYHPHRNPAPFILLLILLTACSGGTDPGPSRADVSGTWLVTFSPNSSCTLSQMTLTLTQQGTVIHGTSGTVGISCPNTNPLVEPAQTVVAGSVNGDAASVTLRSGSLGRYINGMVSVNTWTGTFGWGVSASTTVLTGTFTAQRQ
ncbi:MAG: hypothetical protein AB7I33_05595 [Gemmatimonadales bacterium]